LFPDAHERLRDVVVASIGPITSDTCRKLGLRVDVEANPYTLPALIEALERAFSAR
jgi:uroporphyrinogen III methyltransferase/synthase